MSADPLAGKYPFYTPYQYAGNKPVNFIDLDGLESNGNIGQEKYASENTTTLETNVVVNDAYGDETAKAESQAQAKSKRSINLVIMVDNNYLPATIEREGEWDVISVSSLNEFIDPNSDASKKALKLIGQYDNIQNLAFIRHGRWEWPTLIFGKRTNNICPGDFQVFLFEALYQEDIEQYLKDGQAFTESKTQTLRVLQSLGSLLADDATIFFGACGAGRQCPGTDQNSNDLPQLTFELLSKASGSSGLTLYFPQDDYTYYGVPSTIGRGGYISKSPAFGQNLIGPWHYHDGMMKVTSAGTELFGNLVMQRAGLLFEEKSFSRPVPLKNSKYCWQYCK